MKWLVVLMCYSTLALRQCNSKGLIFGDIKLDDDGAFRMH